MNTIFQDACLQPLINHPSDDTIRDSPVKKVSKVGVRNRIEIFDDVDVYPPPQSLAHDGGMLSCAPLCSNRVLTFGCAWRDSGCVVRRSRLSIFRHKPEGRDHSLRRLGAEPRLPKEKADVFAGQGGASTTL
jgi:hypothetical protein